VNTTCRRTLCQRRVEVQPAGDALAQELQPGEHCVTFVEVIDIDRDAERAQQAHPTDTKDDLLRHAVVATAAVEAPGDPAVALLDRLDQKERRQPRPLDLPRGQGHLVAAHPHRRARPGRDQVGAGGVRVVVDDGARGRRPLHGVPLGPEDAERADGEPQIAGRLDVITGQDAEAAGVDRQIFAEGVFHAEIGDAGDEGLGHGGML
jgi:hypothetical protein